MTRALLLMSASLLLVPVAAAVAQQPRVAARPAVAAAPTSIPEIGKFGLDVDGMDPQAAAGTDFYRRANGGWDRTTEFPADRAVLTMYGYLDDISRRRTRRIIEDIAAANPPPGSEADKVKTYYLAFMDEDAIEARGLGPVRPMLSRIEGIRDRGDLARLIGELTMLDVGLPFHIEIAPDAKKLDRYVPILRQSGLTMPSRDYYLSADPKLVQLRQTHLAHIERMFTLAGFSEPGRRARAAQDIETGLARGHWTNVDSRDRNKTYNLWPKADFADRAPGFDWRAYFAAAGLNRQADLVVAQPSAVAAAATLLNEAPLPAWKDYLAYQALKKTAPFLPRAIVAEDFSFDGTALYGQPQMRPRWQRGANRVNEALGDAVAKEYVERHFRPEAKAAADALVRNIIRAMDARLERLDWMAPETKTKARAKLAAFTPKIGYPDKWRDYTELRIQPEDALGNAVRAALFEYRRNLDKLGTPVDRREWRMRPMEANAYADLPMNEIVFPAAILQPPFFDPNADPAVNYGAIGGIIGHEISHHFDDQGRKYDPSGRLAEWWTAEDVERFKSAADKLVAQYGQYEPLPGTKVNGALALGENIADLAGTLIAHDAYRLSLGGQKAPVLDGLTGDQRFYLAWAQIWRTKYREAGLREQLVKGPHAPGPVRVNVLRNHDDWHRTWGVKPGDALYLAPQDRVRIW